MSRDSNLYTFLFVGIMIVGIASILAYTSQTLKPMQDENVKNEKMQNILSTVGINVSRDEAEKSYKKYIVEELALKIDGSINENINPFSDLNLAKELKKDYEDQHFPLYVAEINSEKYYIIELRGTGLWDAIWGYISLKSDFNTVNGVSFDHKGETAGLGAEITKDWFKESFKDEKIFNSDGELVGITVLKGNNDPNNIDKDDHEVDAISGSTITGDGVTDMIYERVSNYLPYLSLINDKVSMR
ncbi:NADH:ubiquinone reductase (Na(+)-transporting) subunit C [Flavobacteriales bacterium]|jgi:Na+-transporting NADH:ubiquinone oxidoreductase subunit C|nr:NADH:ubiquinone reductase (Na(+)-transporting) subunit C [Flavobacteriales bacterium]|tara:strand:+ start:3076 stop:3807 length:732 start_codon:yes stop_codon:yes gene_type:complete